MFEVKEKQKRASCDHKFIIKKKTKKANRLYKCRFLIITGTRFFDLNIRLSNN